jgi:hypothetical protein
MPLVSSSIQTDSPFPELEPSAPCRPPLFHGPGSENLGISLFKQFPLGDMRKIDLRFKFFSALNHANFANPATSMSTPATFGKVNATVNDPREIQLAGKFYF